MAEQQGGALSETPGAPTFICRDLCLYAFFWDESPGLASTSRRELAACLPSKQGQTPGSCRHLRARVCPEWLQKERMGDQSGTVAGSFSGPVSLRQSLVVVTGPSRTSGATMGEGDSHREQNLHSGLPPKRSLKGRCLPGWEKGGRGTGWSPPSRYFGRRSACLARL